MKDHRDCFKESRHRRDGITPLVVILAAWLLLSGCHTTQNKQSFFTSGNREADQRASQFMARREQLAGTAQGHGTESASPARAENKRTLYVRLGGEAGIANIVADFIPRVLNDPRVNWERKGVSTGGFLGLFKHRHKFMWQATPQNVALLKKHMAQFIDLCTGGPAQYDGRSIKSVHHGMNISDPEFNAALGDLKATLDKLKVPNTEQKELLAIVETTRPLIVKGR